MKKIILSLFGFCAILGVSAQSVVPLGDATSEAKAPLVVDELVAIVGDQPIMLSDVQRTTLSVIEQRKAQGVTTTQEPKAQAIEILLLNKFMSASARRDSLDKDLSKSMVAEIVEKNVDQMVAQAGGVKQLERRYGKAIFQIKRDVERDMLDNELSRMMQDKIMKEIPVGYSDVAKFFSKLPLDSLPEMPPQFTYSQIVKMPEATEERKFKIREQLLEFRQRVINGEKLAVLARLYSQDLGTKSRGGEMTGALSEVVAPFAQALEMLEPGQISEIVETEYGMHIIELISQQGPRYHYRHLLLKPEFTVEEETKVVLELDSLRTEINEKRLTFADAAERYSNHPESAQNGGRVMNLRAYMQTGDISMAGSSFPLDEIDPNDYRYLSQLTVDSISIPFETMDDKGNRVYKVVRLDAKLPSHPASLENDYDILLRITSEDKKNRELDKWIDKNVANMYVYIAPGYRDTNFDRKQWLEACEKYENSGLVLKLPQSER